MRQRSFMTDEQITARIEQEFQMELIQLAINEKAWLLYTATTIAFNYATNFTS